MIFYLPLFASLMGLVSLLDGVSATGINCEGNGNCLNGISSQLLSDMTTIVEQHVDPTRYYSNGEQIVCELQSDICAFCQNSNGAPGSSIITLIQELHQHGCTVCGSIPLFYPADNNVANGELTVNYASNHCGGASYQYGDFNFDICS